MLKNRIVIVLEDGSVTYVTSGTPDVEIVVHDIDALKVNGYATDAITNLLDEVAMGCTQQPICHSGAAWDCMIGDHVEASKDPGEVSDPVKPLSEHVGMNLVLLRSADNDEYDQYLVAPEGMNIGDAVNALDGAVRKIKAALPSAYQFEDLVEAAESLGFTWPQVDACQETW